MMNVPSTSSSSSSSSANSGPINYTTGAPGALRISGLASGIDVDSIVKKLMTAEAIPLDQMKQQQQLLEWKRDDYRSMNSALLDLQNSTFNMTLQGTFLAETATSSNPSVVTATAGGSAGNTTYSLSNITQLATAAYNNSPANITNTTSFDPSASLASMQSDFATQPTFDSNGNFSFNITTYDQSGNKVSHDFSFNSSQSLNDVISAINDSNVGVNAFYDSQSGRVSFTRTLTGKNNPTGQEMTLTDTSGNFLTGTLGLVSGNEKGASDASFTLNGLTTTRHSNTFTVNGTTLTLNGTTTAGQTVTVTNSPNTDTIFKSIQDWVNKYNDTIKTVNDKIAEKRNLNYAPLTDAQKSQMNSNDSTLWTDKAKSGMLSTDNILPSGLSEMRQDLYSPVSGTSDSTMNQLAEIGITTSSNYADNGKLEIDENTLKQAISNNPKAVMDLFTANGSTTDTQGIAVRLNNTLTNTMNKITQEAGSDGSVDSSYFLGTQLTDMNTQITDFEQHLNDVQNRYYSQFTAMEQAISTSNQQAAMLQGQLGGSSSGG